MASSNTSRRNGNKLPLYKDASQIGGAKKRTSTSVKTSSATSANKAKVAKKPIRTKPVCPTPGPVLNTPGGMVTFTPLSSFYKSDTANKTPADKSVTEKSIHEVGSQVTDEYEMELLHARLLQMTYLDVMSAKALKKQEGMAKSQLHWLWEEVEKKKEEVTQLQEKLESETRKMELDKALQVQENGLQTLCSQLLSLEQDYSTLMQALDSTRHNMAIEGALPVHEELLEKELTEVELVLSEIKDLLKQNLPETLDLSSSMDCLCGIVGEEHEQLTCCDKDITDLLRVQVRKTSYQMNKWIL